MTRLDALHPSPDDARRAYRRELLDPKYHTNDPVQRVLDWLQRALNDSLDAASQVPPLGQAAAMLVFLGLAVGLGLLLSRARRTAAARRDSGPVLSQERVTARELRERADSAFSEGRFGDAVVDGFRALTLRQIESGVLGDVPEATAHEVAHSLAADHPDVRREIGQAALLFDLVLYGERPATREQADLVLGLDDRLAGARR